MDDDSRLRELGTMLAVIDKARPKASLLYARILLALLAAPDRSMAVSDLSDALGRGRDSTATQTAVALLVQLGLATSEQDTRDADGGRKTIVRLKRPARIVPSRKTAKAAA